MKATNNGLTTMTRLTVSLSPFFYLLLIKYKGAWFREDNHGALAPGLDFKIKSKLKIVRKIHWNTTVKI